MSLTQNPCLFTLSFPDAQGERDNRRVWIFPFGYDKAGVSESSFEQLENASLEAAKRAKPLLLSLFAKAAALCLQEPGLPEPVGQALRSIESGLELSLDWFGFEGQTDELGPGWARASARGLDGLPDGAALSALALCANSLRAMGASLVAAKANEGLLNFCEERSDEMPASAPRAVMAHSLSLFASGFSISKPIDSERRPVSCVWMRLPDPADANAPGSNAMVFWPAPASGDRMGLVKERLHIIKALMDAKNEAAATLSKGALDLLTQIGEQMGVGGSTSTAVRLPLAAPEAVDTRVGSIALSLCDLKGSFLAEDFSAAFKALAQNLARQTGPSCGLAGASANALARGLASGSLAPDEWSSVSRLLKKALDAVPAPTTTASPAAPEAAQPSSSPKN